MTKTLVHIKVLNGTEKETQRVLEAIKELIKKDSLDGYEFIITNDRIEVTTLANEIIKNATTLADKILKERS